MHPTVTLNTTTTAPTSTPNPTATPAPVEALGNGIYRIDTRMQRAGLDSCYLLGEGEHWALIDTGPAICMDTVLAGIQAAGVALESIRLVCPTHVHLDHAGGVGSILAHLPNATVLAQARAYPHLVDPSKLNAGARAVYGEAELLRLFGYLQPTPTARIRAVADNETVMLGTRRLQFIDSPGHARHHYCVWDETSQGFFTGDTFGLSYRELDTEQGAFIMATTTPVQFDPQGWQHTLDRFAERQPQQMFLTHFSRVQQVEALTAQLREDINAHCEIAKRHADAGADRHAQLLQALAEHELERVARHGCKLPPAQVHQLLAMDLELNAQGLGVWLDRQTAGRA